MTLSVTIELLDMDGKMIVEGSSAELGHSGGPGGALTSGANRSGDNGLSFIEDSASDCASLIVEYIASFTTQQL